MLALETGACQRQGSSWGCLFHDSVPTVEQVVFQIPLFLNTPFSLYSTVWNNRVTVWLVCSFPAVLLGSPCACMHVAFSYSPPLIQSLGISVKRITCCFFLGVIGMCQKKVTLNAVHTKLSTHLRITLSHLLHFLITSERMTLSNKMRLKKKRWSWNENREVEERCTAGSYSFCWEVRVIVWGTWREKCSYLIFQGNCPLIPLQLDLLEYQIDCLKFPK